MYRGPEQAYATLDFSGRGYIFPADILSNPIVKQLGLSSKIYKVDVELMLKTGNMFPSIVDTLFSYGFAILSGSISFDLFKKIFFPQLYHLKEETQSDEDREVLNKKRDIAGLLI